MKKVTLSTLALALALSAAGVFAQQKTDDMKGQDMNGMDMKSMGKDKKPAASKPTTHMAKGVVKRIDARSGTVTITMTHAPVMSMNWPKMTMGFRVKNKVLLDKFTAALGNKVEFEFEQEGKDFVVTSVK